LCPDNKASRIEGDLMFDLTLRCGAALIAAIAFTTGAAAGQTTPRGTFVCTVEQTAGIGAEMQEGAAPPASFIDKRVVRFRISVTPPAKRTKARVVETPRPGEKALVLQGAYVGDGTKFTTTKEQAFLRLDFIGEAGWLWFYHAGFEKPDIDHLNLTVRTGPCEPAK
jgi:hypothetical protein